MLRRIAMSLLLSATPALAQLDHDPENDPPLHASHFVMPAHIIPPSQVNAGKAAVAPAGKTVSGNACSPSNPCAQPTPAAR